MTQHCTNIFSKSQSSKRSETGSRCQATKWPVSGRARASARSKISRSLRVPWSGLGWAWLLSVGRVVFDAAPAPPEGEPSIG